jgi:hypothetical protein
MFDSRARDVELAKFEAFLKQHETLDISALVRGSQRLAYPIKGYAHPATPFVPARDCILRPVQTACMRRGHG